MFDPVEFYQFAGQLYQKKSEREVENRIIINRAYYSAFLCARNFSKISNSSGSVHKEVIDYFEKQPNKIIFNQLKQLKDLRHKADYDLKTVILSRQAGKSLKLAEHILNKLKYLI